MPRANTGKLLALKSLHIHKHTLLEKIRESRVQDEGYGGSPSAVDVVGASEICKIFSPSQNMARGKVQQTIFIMENRKRGGKCRGPLPFTRFSLD